MAAVALGDKQLLGRGIVEGVVGVVADTDTTDLLKSGSLDNQQSAVLLDDVTAVELGE